VFIPVFTSFLYATSMFCARRSSQIHGPAKANLLRIGIAAFVLAFYAFLIGSGVQGAGLYWLLLSGILGMGIGDAGFFAAMPRLGPQLSGIIYQCLAAPFGILIEWLWLGILPARLQMVAALVVLTGVCVALWPKEKFAEVSWRQKAYGILFALIAALGQSSGAVATRKAVELNNATGTLVDPITQAFQRSLGGLGIILIIYLWVSWKTRRLPISVPHANASTGTKIFWPTSNAVVGAVLGVASLQWALASMPAGIVLSIVATSPLLLIFMAWIFDGEKPSKQHVVGGILAVIGVAGLRLVA
jgi:drug/metabolite transporter (DMT)-like permease